MAARSHLLLVLAGVFASLGPRYATPNFDVQAPTSAVAQRVGRAAERYRRELARQWLGKPMPTWKDRCPLHVTLTAGAAGGATTFWFENDHVIRMEMRVDGPLDRLLTDVLPHEVGHTVFAHFCGRPVARWADEGAAISCEDGPERERHTRQCLFLLRQGRALSLRRLLELHDYPIDNLTALYAQGYTVADFLIRARGRRTFLAFVKYGMDEGWDEAAAAYYGYRSVEQLERAWRADLCYPKSRPGLLEVVRQAGAGVGAVVATLRQATVLAVQVAAGGPAVRPASHQPPSPPPAAAAGRSGR